jgi:hypothetical protein
MGPKHLWVALTNDPNTFSLSHTRVARWHICETKMPFLVYVPWRALKRKMLVYFLSIWDNLWPCGLFYGRLVYFVVFGYISSRFGTFFQETSGSHVSHTLATKEPLQSDAENWKIGSQLFLGFFWAVFCTKAVFCQRRANEKENTQELSIGICAAKKWRNSSLKFGRSKEHEDHFVDLIRSQSYDF